MAVIPFLHQAGRAEPELAERAGAILRRAMRLRSSKRLWYSTPTTRFLRLRFGVDLDRLAVLQHQRFDGADMLIVPQRRHDHVEVQLIGDGDDDNLARRQPR